MVIICLTAPKRKGTFTASLSSPKGLSDGSVLEALAAGLKQLGIPEFPDASLFLRKALDNCNVCIGVYLSGHRFCSKSVAQLPTVCTDDV